MSLKQAIRVTTYDVAFGTSGLTATLILDQPLAEHWFALVNTDFASDAVGMHAVRVAYTGSESESIAIVRGVDSVATTAQVTVVECLDLHDTDGFRVQEVISATIPASSGDGVQTTSHALSTTIRDLSRAVILGGLRCGGGASTAADSSINEIKSLEFVITNTDVAVSTSRFEGGGAGGWLKETFVTIFVVIFGRNWIAQSAVQNSFPTPSTTALATAVPRANTMLFPYARTPWEAVIGAGGASGLNGVAIGLGDGSTQEDTESAIFLRYHASVPFGESYRWGAYVISHPDLSAQWISIPDTGSSGPLNAWSSLSLPEDSPLGREHQPARGRRAGGKLAVLSSRVLATGSVLAQSWHTWSTNDAAITLGRAEGDATAGRFLLEAVVADFGVIGQSEVVITDSTPAIRTTTYQIESGEYGGTEIDLPLEHPLARNYFVMVYPYTTVGSSGDFPNLNLYRLIGDPWGTGGLEATNNARVLRFSGAGFDQRGTIVVVESIRGHDTDGFRLRDMLVESFALDENHSVQANTSRVGESRLTTRWKDASRVVPFAGIRGGGLDMSTGIIGNEWSFASFRSYLAGDNLIRTERRTRGTYGGNQTTTVTICVVEWGSRWTVEHAIVNLTAAGDGSDPADWNEASLGQTFRRARTWAWGCGYSGTDEGGVNNGILALGDGSTQSDDESSVAVLVPDLVGTGLWDAYVMSHPRLVVTHRPRANATTTSPVTFAVPAPIAGEQRTGTEGVAQVQAGSRMPLGWWATTDATVDAMADLAYTDDTTLQVTWTKLSDPDPEWTGLILSIDFGRLALESYLYQQGPMASLILRDRNWQDGGENAVSATSQGGAVVGPLVPNSANPGSVIGFQAGSPTTDDEIEYRIVRAGRVDGSAADAGQWAWRLAGDPDDGWRGANDLVMMRSPIFGELDPELEGRTAIVYHSRSHQMLYFQRVDNDTINLHLLPLHGGPYEMGAAIALAIPCTAISSAWFLDAVELPDGSILLVTSTISQATGFTDANLWVNTGETWATAGWRAANEYLYQNALAGTAMYANGGRSMQISGDWVRLGVVYDPSQSAAWSMRTIVSPNRGASWSALTDVGLNGTADALTNNLVPFDIVSVTDTTGTFFALRRGAGGASDVIEVYVGHRDEDWVRRADLDQDLALGGTSPTIHSLSAVRTPTSIYIFANARSSTEAGIYVVRVDVDNPYTSDGWTLVGRAMDIWRAASIYPSQWSSVWGGSGVFMFGGLLDPSTVNADPQAEGWFAPVLGRWSTHPLALAPDEASALRDGPVASLYWAAWMGEPQIGNGSSEWQRSGTATFSLDSEDGLVVNATSVQTGVYSFNMGSGVSTEDEWGYANGQSGTTLEWTVLAPVGDSRTGRVNVSLESSDVAIRVMYNTDSIRVEFGSTGTFIDITTPVGTSWHRCRLVAVDDDFWFEWRNLDGGEWGREYVGTHAGGFGVNNEVELGILDTGVAAKIQFQDLIATYRSSYSRGANWSNPGALAGAPLTTRRQAVAGGVEVSWGGSGAMLPDRFTGRPVYSRGLTNLGVDSPRYSWESVGTGEASIVLVADPDQAGDRWALDALALVGTRGLSARLELGPSPTDWSAPVYTTWLDASLHGDLYVVSVAGSRAQVWSATGEEPVLGAGIGLYLWVGGFCARIISQQGDGWVEVESGTDLVAEGVAPGTSAMIYADRMVALGDEVPPARYARITFPSGEVALGSHALGALVPGQQVPIQIPLEWVWSDDEQPRITEYASRSGVTWEYEEGPPLRRVEARIVGDIHERVAESLRGLLRELQGYSIRPLALIVDDQQPVRSMLYGRWTGGSDRDLHVWSPTKQGAWVAGGDLPLSFREEK